MSGKPSPVKMKFEVQVRRVDIEEYGQSLGSSYVMLSVGRKARVATSTPAVVKKSDNGFAATWSDNEVVAMIVNMQPADNDHDHDDKKLESKDLKFTLRHVIGEEKVMKTLANCRLDVSQVASTTSTGRSQRLTLDMKPTDSWKDEIKTVKLEVSALCQPLEIVASPQVMLPSTETRDDELSDIEVRYAG